MSCLFLMLDNNKLFETVLYMNDEENGEIISIKLQLISKPVLTANDNIDYKTITHNYTSPGNKKDSDIIMISLAIFLRLYLIKLEIKNAMY